MGQQEEIEFDGFKSMKPGGYYWRLLGRELDDIEKLRQVVGFLIKEIETHRQEAESMMIWPDDVRCASEGAKLAMNGSAEALQELIGILVGNLEAFRRCFREFGEWPPVEFEPRDVAKALLGYDPDEAEEAINDEL